MATTTLPTITDTIDNQFVSTWYDIRPVATDNILAATPIWALLKQKGRFVKQVGGRLIERTVRYALPTVQAVTKGDILGEGEVEVETGAFWEWRYISTAIQRSIFDDQKNAGKFQIKSYLNQRITAAKDAMAQAHETKIFNAHTPNEDGKDLIGLNDIVPPVATRNTGTYGKIARPTTYTSDVPTVGNIWWSPKYKSLSGAIEQTLVSDMKNLYNSIYNNQIPPDIIITDQPTFELYEEYGLDATQVIKNEGNQRLLDLGFEMLQFKGKPMTWTPNIAASNVLMLTSQFIDVVWDPNMWMAMTEWKPIAKQGERLAHILSACVPITDQPRRHGRLS
jgi:hypothetical protein